MVMSVKLSFLFKRGYNTSQNVSFITLYQALHMEMFCFVPRSSILKVLLYTYCH